MRFFRLLKLLIKWMRARNLSFSLLIFFISVRSSVCVFILAVFSYMSISLVFVDMLFKIPKSDKVAFREGEREKRPKQGKGRDERAREAHLTFYYDCETQNSKQIKWIEVKYWNKWALRWTSAEMMMTMKKRFFMSTFLCNCSRGRLNAHLIAHRLRRFYFEF